MHSELENEFVKVLNLQWKQFACEIHQIKRNPPYRPDLVDFRRERLSLQVENFDELVLQANWTVFDDFWTMMKLQVSSFRTVQNENLVEK